MSESASACACAGARGYLVPALGVNGKRVERFARDHREQSELLSYVVAQVREPSPPAVLFARSMVIFADLLREDMRREEAQTLTPSALRGSGIRFEAMTG